MTQQVKVLKALGQFYVAAIDHEAGTLSPITGLLPRERALLIARAAEAVLDEADSPFRNEYVPDELVETVLA